MRTAKVKTDQKVYFIGTESPANPEKISIDQNFIYSNPKIAIENAKKQATAKYPNATIKQVTDERLGVFIKIGEELALINIYYIKPVTLINSVI